MPIIPIFKKYSQEQLITDFDLIFDIPEWVSIELPIAEIIGLDNTIQEKDAVDDETITYETNRYDVQFEDTVKNKTISVYLYFDEHNETVIAIDSTVQDPDLNIQYPIQETPFAEIIQILQAKPNN